MVFYRGIMGGMRGDRYIKNAITVRGPWIPRLELISWMVLGLAIDPLEILTLNHLLGKQIVC